jgi:hypothetical protein
MEHIPSSEANSSSAGQIPLNPRNAKVHCRAHKTPPLVISYGPVQHFINILFNAVPSPWSPALTRRPSLYSTKAPLTTTLRACSSHLLSAICQGRGLNPPPPRISEVLTKLSRIPSSVEYASVTTSTETGFIHFQIEWNPWLGRYRPQIPVLSALCPQLNLLTAPLPTRKNSWVSH